MKKIINFVVFLICFSKNICSFNTLSDAKQFAEINPELVKMDNQDTNNPDYSSFLKKKFSRSSYYLKKLSKNKFLWSPNFFKDILRLLIERRKSYGYSGNFIDKISPVSSYLFIWGSLHGSFHSLVRDLEYLEKKGFIDNEFRITSPNCYLIFNGNVADGSPYIIETLTLIMCLMKANIDRIFYIKGRLEYQSYWKNYGLNRELKIKFNENLNDLVRLEDSIDKFFDTLPLALYLDGINPYDGLLRISYFSLRDNIINESYCPNLLSNLFIDKVDMCKLTPPEKKGAPEVKVIIRHQDHQSSFKDFSGLYSLEPDIGATTWKIFSAPTDIYQKFYEFYNDAFFLVKTGFNLIDYSISIISRDVREKFNYEIKTFNLVTTKEEKTIDLIKPITKFNPSDDQVKSLKEKMISIQNKIEEMNFKLYKLKNNLENIT